MPAQNSSSDRYSTSGGREAEFVDDAQTILVNKLGIADLHELQLREEESLIECYHQMTRTVRVDTPLSNRLICEIHNQIFGDLFEWGGRWRTVWLSKGGTTWANPSKIDALMSQFEIEVLQQQPYTESISDSEFCRIAALIQGEFLTIHPFREGNARTIKVLTDLFAIQNDRPVLNYDESELGKQEYIEAAIAAYDRNYYRLEAIIKRALDESRLE